MKEILDFDEQSVKVKNDHTRKAFKAFTLASFFFTMLLLLGMLLGKYLVLSGQVEQLVLTFLMLGFLVFVFFAVLHSYRSIKFHEIWSVKKITAVIGSAIYFALVIIGLIVNLIDLRNALQ